MTDAELIALAALVVADAVEVIAANQQAQVQGYSPAYSGFHPNPFATQLEAELDRRRVWRHQHPGKEVTPA